MKISAATCLLLTASASAFVPSQRPAFTRPLHMAGDDGGALVPIKDETVEFTAGIIGGAAGLIIGGPFLAAIGAAAANYASKTDNEASDVMKAVSKSSLEAFNYLADLDSKYEILNKAKDALEESLLKLKASGPVDPNTVEKVEGALKNTNQKIQEVNDEYDLVGGSVTALGIVGDLVEKAVAKAGELNEEYQLTGKAKDALSTAVDKAQSAAAKAK